MHRWIKLLLLVLPMLVGMKGAAAYKKQGKRDSGFSARRVAACSSDKALAWRGDGQQQRAVNALLDQPFVYLGRGKQCYVFASSDGQYVLKFLQEERLTVKRVVRLKWLLRDQAHVKQKRRKRLLESLLLAQKRAPEETAMVYVHLTPTKHLHGSVTLLDNKGRVQRVDLDRVVFVVQRKAEALKPTLVRLMYQGKVREAKQRIEQLFTLLVECANKGVLDRDSALIRNNNVGFLEGRAVYVDTGKLVAHRGAPTQKVFLHDLRRLRPLQTWLSKNYPALATHFTHCRERALLQLDHIASK